MNVFTHQELGTRKGQHPDREHKAGMWKAQENDPQNCKENDPWEKERAPEWDEVLKTGQIIPLHTKGDSKWRKQLPGSMPAGDGEPHPSQDTVEETDTMGRNIRTSGRQPKWFWHRPLHIRCHSNPGKNKWRRRRPKETPYEEQRSPGRSKWLQSKTAWREKSIPEI